MRKISLLMLMTVLFACFSANATDYYLIGGFNNWTKADAACKFTDKGDGTFVLNYSGTLTSGFKVNDGTWENDDVNFGSNGEDLVVGTPYYYGTGGMSGDITMSGAVSNPTVTLNPTEGTILVEGQAGTVTVTYAIHGCLASADWVDTALTESGSNWVANNVTVSNATAEFGIKKYENGNQSAWYAASEAVTVSGSTTINLVGSNSKNISIAAGTYSFSFNPSTLALTITANGSGPIDPPNPPTPTGNFGVVGSMQTPTEWDIVNPIPMTANGNVYTLTLNNVAAGTIFKIARLGATSWTDAVSYGAEGTLDQTAPIDVALVDGVEANAWLGSSNNFLIENAMSTCTITFTYVQSPEGENLPSTIMISGEGSGPIDPPNPPTPTGDFGVVGSMQTPTEWDIVNPIPMTANGNVYTLTLNNVAAGTIFKIARLGATSWTDAISYGAEGTLDQTAPIDVALVDGVEANAWLGSSNNFLIEDAMSTCTITFTYVQSPEGENLPSTIMISGEGSGPIDPPNPPTPTEGFGVVGSMQDWDIVNPVKMNGNDNVYTVNFDNLPAGTIFKIAKLGATKPDWSDAVSFGAEGTLDQTAPIDVPVEIGEEMNAWVGSSNNFLIESAIDNVTIQFTYAESNYEEFVPSILKVTSGGSEVELTVVKDEPAVYYNLNGVRVDNATNGVYIVRRGNSVSKVVVR